MKKGKNSSNKLNLKTQFKEALSYLKESSKYIYFAVLIFVISAIFGFANSNQLSFIDKFLKEIISQTLNLGPIELIFFILQNNLQSALISLAGGIFLGIFPLINAITNGVIIGYVMSKTYSAAGLLVLWRLIPHGIFELPAIFISLGLGIKMGFSFFSKNKSEEFKKRFFNSANVFLMIVIPLLIIAAIIEGLLIVFMN